jgi:hypothetical protein
MRVKYFRQSDPRLGFKLREEMKIESEDKKKFSVEISKLNSLYKQCA